MKFKINLKKPADLESYTHLTKTTFLATCGGGGCPIKVGKHGDIFELSGTQAYRLKRIIDDFQILDLETYEIPTVTGLDITEEDLIITITWNQNESYLTEVDVQVNDGEWNAFTSSTGELQP